MKNLILGDVHAAWGDAQDIIQEARKKDGPFDRIIQVGDMGFGFPGLDPWMTLQDEKCIWIDGNHDNHDMLLLRDRPNFGNKPEFDLSQWRAFLALWEYKARGTIEDGILFIGGAHSIDKHMRTPGVDWWSGETLSYRQTEEVLQAIEAYGPQNIHTVISHDCADGFNIGEGLRAYQGGTAKLGRDYTREFLEEVRQIVMPERWYFGHYHFPWEGELDGCKWRCIDMSGSRHGQDYVVLES